MILTCAILDGINGAINAAVEGGVEVLARRTARNLSTDASREQL